MKIIYYLAIILINEASCTKEKCIEDIFCIPADYNKLQRPTKEKVQVDLELDIIEVLDFDDKDFSSTIMMWLKAAWIEPRLKSNTSTKHPIDLSVMEDLWMPDIYIYNLKWFKNDRILTKLAGLIIKEMYLQVFSKYCFLQVCLLKGIQ